MPLLLVTFTPMIRFSHNRVMPSSQQLVLSVFFLLLFIITVSSESWTPIVVKNVTLLGSQSSKNVNSVSRDGGHSVLLNRRIIWLYDDTECISQDGQQLSFLSNTAAYASSLESGVLNVTDFGVIVVGKNAEGYNETAILSDQAVGDGGWIPFDKEESDFNQENKGTRRIAICMS